MTELEFDRVIGLARGYQEPRVLLTASELDLFSILGAASMTAEEIATPRGWEIRALSVLLDALTVMGFLEKRLGRYFVPRVNRDLLAPGDARLVREIIRNSASGWHSWSTLTSRIVGTGVQSTSLDAASFIATMHAMSQPLAPGIAALVRPRFRGGVNDKIGLQTKSQPSAAGIGADNPRARRLFDVGQKRIGQHKIRHMIDSERHL